MRLFAIRAAIVLAVALLIFCVWEFNPAKPSLVTIRNHAATPVAVDIRMRDHSVWSGAVPAHGQSRAMVRLDSEDGLHLLCRDALGLHQLHEVGYADPSMAFIVELDLKGCGPVTLSKMDPLP